MQGTASHRGLRACTSIKGVFSDHLYFQSFFTLKYIELKILVKKKKFLAYKFSGDFFIFLATQKAFLSIYAVKNALEDTRESEEDNDQVIDSLLKK